MQGLFNVIGHGNQKAVACTPEFLDQLTSQAIVFYLAVAHYGRGRGTWREAAALDRWSDTALEVLDTHRAQLRNTWKAMANATSGDTNPLQAEVTALIRESLVAQYPDAGNILGSPKS